MQEQLQFHLFHSVSFVFVTSFLYIATTNDSLLPMFLYSRTYDSKRDYFELMEDSESVKLSSQAEAEQFLAFGKKTGQAMEDDELRRLKQDQDNGMIAKSATFDDLQFHAERAGAHNQAMVMIHNPPSMKGFDFIEQQIQSVQHTKGSTYTDGYGDLRNHSGTAATNQRATNTRLNNASSLNAEAEKLADEKIYLGQLEESKKLSLQRDSTKMNQTELSQLRLAQELSLYYLGPRTFSGPSSSSPQYGA